MLHHAYLVKGFLLGKDAPRPIMDAIEAIIAEIPATVITVSSDRLPGFSVAIADDECPLPSSTEPQVDGSEELTAETGGQEDLPPASPQEDSAVAKPKRKHNMSLEAREGARQRMIAMQARKRAEKEAAKVSSQPDPAGSPKPAISEATKPASKHKPFPVIDHERLISVHNGYAGKREDGQIVDSDWPDIKARLARGDTREAIASDYDVAVEDLDFFIASCQRREANTPGEAPASPSGVASDATKRPTW